MKFMFALLLAASFTACGSKSKPATTPDNADTNATGTTETQPTDGTGGATYGGETPAPEGAEPAAAPAE